MRFFRFGFSAAVMVLAGCASPGGPSTSPLVLPLSLSKGAVPACAGSRIGQAQCDAFVEPGGAHATYAGWTASDLETAYDLPSSTKGKGQIVAVVDSYDNPDAATDLAQYRSAMGLPAGTLDKYNQDGQMSNYPTGSPNWGVEIDLDVEMASASCPNCTIYLVEANSNKWSDIETAEAQAVKLGATIVSNSYDGSGASESYYDTPGITYVASDAGYGLYDPATFDSVVAVGGTMLEVSGNRRGYKETVWPDTGGGCSSTDETAPPWQHHTACSPYRIGNDVCAVAVGAAEYDTYDEGGWITIDGTSIGSPFIAGIFALAGNSTHQDGGRTFWNPAHHKYLHKLGGGFTDGGGWGSPHGIRAF